MEKNTYKILYFGSFDKPYDTEVYICNTLEMLGCFVDRRKTTTISLLEFEGLLAQEWDAVVFSKGWFGFNPNDMLRILLNTKNTTIGWFWDLCWNTPREKILYSHQVFKSKITLTSDGGERDWKSLGINHFTLRQGIYEPEAILGTPQEKYKYDVVFVGTNAHKDTFGWTERNEILEFLKETYSSNFRHFGKKDEVRNMELNNLYASAKVVVGDSVYSPNYWSNRLYETLGRGGFLIFPNIPGIEKEFTPYKHFIPYEIGDYEGLKRKIDYYLTHDKEREEIRLAGFEYCKKMHSYTIRCKELLKFI